jgi:hypothetical protein
VAPPRSARRRALSAKEAARRRERAALARRRKEEIYAAADAAGKRRPRCFAKGRSSIEFLLSEKELTEYLALLRRAGTTVRVASDWLKERGHVVGTEAVRRHRNRFVQRLAQQRDLVEMSNMITSIAREHGAASTTDAAVTFAEQQLLLTMFDGVHAQRKGETFDADRWLAIQKMLGHALRNRREVERMRKVQETFRKDPRPLKEKLTGFLGLRTRQEAEGAKLKSGSGKAEC